MFWFGWKLWNCLVTDKQHVSQKKTWFVIIKLFILLSPYTDFNEKNVIAWFKFFNYEDNIIKMFLEGISKSHYNYIHNKNFITLKLSVVNYDRLQFVNHFHNERYHSYCSRINSFQLRYNKLRRQPLKIPNYI